METEPFLLAIQKKSPPAPEAEVYALENSLGTRLPEDYRDFLLACNGGYLGGALWFTGPTPNGQRVDAGVHHIGGIRAEPHLSLAWARNCYDGRIPKHLLWIMDDPFGNAICLAIDGVHKGKVFFWDHENEPDDECDGAIESAENIQVLANSFAEFMRGLHPSDDDA